MRKSDRKVKVEEVGRNTSKLTTGFSSINDRNDNDEDDDNSNT